MLASCILSLALFLNLITFMHCDDDYPSIIIVGAGAAGIAAASKLLENNFNNVTILEAENRIGGRIFTTTLVDTTVDLGAQWCHGRRGNVVYELAKDSDLLEPEMKEDAFFKYSMCYLSHKELDPDFVEETYGIFWNIYENDKPEREITHAEFLPNRYKEIIKESFGNDTEKMTIALDLLDTFITAVLTYEGAFSLFDVAANGDFEECEGGNLYWKTGGYQNVLNILMHKYPDPTKELPVLSNTLLNKEVTKITWGFDVDQIIVNCSDDTSYSADYVIVTPSLGVLKDRHEELFYPPLPIEKRKVIEELGIGGVIKTFLYYSEPWWPAENFAGFTFVWTEKERENLPNIYPEGPIEDGRSWLLDVLGVYIVNERPNILMVWIAGPLVPEIEELSDAEITNGIIFLLRKFVGHRFKKIPSPDATLRNKWYANNHFRGTYSYETVESRRHRISPEVTLSEPLRSRDGKLRIFFAGEATNPTHYSTVHGAIETGQREAGRIINLYA